MTTKDLKVRKNNEEADKSGPDLRALIASPQAKKQLAAVLPKHMTPDRFVRIVLNAFIRTPKLMKCTQESILQCMMDLSPTGLEPDGRLAHLIPFDKKRKNPATNKWEVGSTICTLIIDYKGYIKLALDSGKISTIHGDVVYENDVFDYQHGTNSFLKHRPAHGDRGMPIEVYTCALMKDGTTSFEVMSIAEVEAIRKRSKTFDKDTGKNSGPWQTDYPEMAKKTCFRRHAKWLPLGRDFRDAELVDADNLAERTQDDPRLDLQMPTAIGEEPESHHTANDPQGETAPQDDGTKISESHVKNLKTMAKSVGVDDDGLVALCLDVGCETKMEDLTLVQYAKLCQNLVTKKGA